MRSEVEVMSKQKKTAGKTAKNRNEYNAERVRRWREQAEKCAEKVAALPGYDSARLVAAEEGKTLPELIVAILCRERLRGKIVRLLPPIGKARKGAELCQLFNAYMDTFYEEEESPRRRDSHEKEIAERALLLVPHNSPDILNRLAARERRVLLRRFYRKGDLTAQKAIDRAIRFAIETKGA